jgi:hypothetical protein
MKKKRTMDEYRQTKDAVYRKPPPKKMPRKSGIVMKETDSKDMPTSTIHHNLDQEVKMSVPPGLEFNKSYTPEELYEAMSKAEKKSEAKKEFGTPSSPKARQEESEWIPNPDLNRSTSKYSQMSKRELEIVGRQYGVEVDRRLRKATIIRIVELAEEAFRKEQVMMEDPFAKKLLQGIFVGIVIGIAIGAVFGYAMGIR